MSFHEFHEPIQVDTPLGRGRALLVERTQHDYFWTVALDNCALVTFTQDKIRIAKSYTHDRGITDEQMREYVKAKAPPETLQEKAPRQRDVWDQACRDALGISSSSAKRYYGLKPDDDTNWMGN